MPGTSVALTGAIIADCAREIFTPPCFSQKFCSHNGHIREKCELIFDTITEQTALQKADRT